MIKKISLSLLLLITIAVHSAAFGEIAAPTNEQIQSIKNEINKGYITQHTTASSETTHSNSSSPILSSPSPSVISPPAVMTPVGALPPTSDQHSAKLSNQEKAKAIDEKLESIKKQEASFVNKLSSLDYHTQNAPKKFYDRNPTAHNKHLPPVYFKSYYLSLAFKAAKEDNNNGVNAVLSKFNFLNGQNKNGDTVLMAAIQSNSLNVARLLLAKGAYVNAVNERKRTALHYAATLGELELIKLLLSMGADYTMTDDRGMKAIDYAYANGQEMAVSMIAEYIKQNNIQ